MNALIVTCAVLGLVAIAAVWAALRYREQARHRAAIDTADDLVAAETALAVAEASERRKAAQDTVQGAQDEGHREVSDVDDLGAALRRAGADYSDDDA